MGRASLKSRWHQDFLHRCRRHRRESRIGSDHRPAPSGVPPLLEADVRDPGSGGVGVVEGARAAGKVEAVDVLAPVGVVEAVVPVDEAGYGAIPRFEDPGHRSRPGSDLVYAGRYPVSRAEVEVSLVVEGEVPGPEAIDVGELDGVEGGGGGAVDPVDRPVAAGARRLAEVEAELAAPVEGEGDVPDVSPVGEDGRFSGPAGTGLGYHVNVVLVGVGVVELLGDPRMEGEAVEPPRGPRIDYVVWRGAAGGVVYRSLRVAPVGVVYRQEPLHDRHRPRLHLQNGHLLSGGGVGRKGRRCQQK